MLWPVTAPAHPPIIEARGLVKRYPGVCAVDGIDLAVPRGLCFGLLGPNGAGKTTTVELLEGIIPASAGSILYKGRALDRRFREEVGIQFQHTALQDFLTVGETLAMFHHLYQRRADLAELIELCSLQDFVDRDTRKLSGGQRQRLLLALALVNDPELVFLDEPTTGLDPQARRNFWDLVELIKSRGKTVILTTHYMDEAYTLCDDIVIMDQGRIIAHGTPEALLEAHFGYVILRLPEDDVAARLDGLDLELSRTPGFVEIRSHDAHHTIQQLLGRGVSLARLTMRSFSLEDLFIALTGKALRA